LETLIVARHALAGSNRDGLASCAVPGPELTPEGIEQAGRLQDALAAAQVELGVATELRRTQETLEIAFAGRDIPTIVVPELDEIDFGSFDGRLLDDYRAWAASEPPTVPAPGGGESRAEAAARFARGLRRVLRRPEATVLLVGHALSLRYILDGARGLVPAARIAPVEHALAHRLTRSEALAAAELLEAWSRSPMFRPSPD
jgi:broad specificity phosphatase PhoE